MKYNLKNRPRPYTTRKNPTKEEVAFLRWFEGFEKELRERAEKVKDLFKISDTCHPMIPIKEILGEEK